MNRFYVFLLIGTFYMHAALGAEIAKCMDDSSKKVLAAGVTELQCIQQCDVAKVKSCNMNGNIYNRDEVTCEWRTKPVTNDKYFTKAYYHDKTSDGVSIREAKDFCNLPCSSDVEAVKYAKIESPGNEDFLVTCNFKKNGASQSTGKMYLYKYFLTKGGIRDGGHIVGMTSAPNCDTIKSAKIGNAEKIEVFFTTNLSPIDASSQSNCIGQAAAANYFCYLKYGAGSYTDLSSKITPKTASGALTTAVVADVENQCKTYCETKIGSATKPTAKWLSNTSFGTANTATCGFAQGDNHTDFYTYTATVNMTSAAK
jgi:hypothetical protein